MVKGFPAFGEPFGMVAKLVSFFGESYDYPRENVFDAPSSFCFHVCGCHLYRI